MIFSSKISPPAIRIITIFCLVCFSFTWGCSSTPFLKRIDSFTRYIKGDKGADTTPEKVKKPRYKKALTPVATPAQKEQIKKDLVIAEEYLAAKEYAQIPAITQKILKTDPACGEASELHNQAYYQMGKSLFDKKRYIESLEMFAEVDPDYQKTEKMLDSIRLKMERQADFFYKRGVKYFINEKLTHAIAQWQRVLVLNPNHPQAAHDIKNAEQLLEKLKKIE